MTRPRRTVMRASCAVLVAGGLLSRPAAAQPGYPYGYPPPFTSAAPPQPALAQPRKPQVIENEGPVFSWDRLPLALVAETRTSWPIDEGAKRLASQRSVGLAGLALQADVFRPREQLVLRVDTGWVKSSIGSFQEGSALEEHVSTNLFLLGASLRYELLRWLAPYARVAGGIGWDKVTVASMDDRDVFWEGCAGGGIFLRTPAMRAWKERWWTPPVAVIGMVEGGYTLATGSDFVLRPELGSSGVAPIPSNTVALGHVGRSAPYLRAAFGLAF